MNLWGQMDRKHRQCIVLALIFLMAVILVYLLNNFVWGFLAFKLTGADDPVEFYLPVVLVALIFEVIERILTRNTEQSI
jgi:hypothetical protein